METVLQWLNMSHRRKVALWMWAVAVTFWLVVLPPILPYLIPTSIFYKPGTLFIHDSVVGVPPAISSKREIKRPFLGRWQGQLWSVDGSRFERVQGCRYESEQFRYRPESTIPPDATLEYWFEIPPNDPCNMSPGQYMVTTEWFITLPVLFWVELTTGVESNVFTIAEPHSGLGLRRRANVYGGDGQ